MTELVSIIIPYYNCELFIEDCLHSVLCIQQINYEICIVDDASFVPLTHKLDQFTLKYPGAKIKHLRNRKNFGAAHARNRALDIASGKYIAFLDADDIMVADRLLLQLDYLKQHPEVVAVGSAVEYINENGNYISSETFPESALNSSGFEGCCASFMVRFYNGVEKIRFNESLLTASEDVDYLIKLSRYGELKNLLQPLYKYRTRRNSLTTSTFWHDDHTEYMVNFASKNLGLTGKSELLLLYFKIDGHQAGDLMATKLWRAFKLGKITGAQLVRSITVFPKSYKRLTCKKINIMKDKFLKLSFLNFIRSK